MRESIEGAVAIAIATLFVAMPGGAVGGFTAYRTFTRMTKTPFPGGFVVPKPEIIDVVVTQGATLTGLLLEGVVGGGVAAISLAMARGQSPRVSDIFSQMRHFVSVLTIVVISGAAFVVGGITNQALAMAGLDPGLAAAAAYLAFIPGFLLKVAWAFAIPLVVDRGIGPIEALSESWKLTQGHRLNIVLVAVLVFVVALIGACACGIGTMVSWPLGSISIAYAYLSVTQQPVAQHD